MTTIRAEQPPGAPLGPVVTWKNLKAGDDGEWIELRGVDPSIHVTGEGECVIEGSNTGGVEGVILENARGMRLKLKAPAISGIGTLTRFIRPRVIGDKADITVILQARAV